LVARPNDDVTVDELAAVAGAKLLKDFVNSASQPKGAGGVVQRGKQALAVGTAYLFAFRFDCESSSNLSATETAMTGQCGLRFHDLPLENAKRSRSPIEPNRR
jgi:hypothetical protein